MAPVGSCKGTVLFVKLPLEAATNVATKNCRFHHSVPPKRGIVEAGDVKVAVLYKGPIPVIHLNLPWAAQQPLPASMVAYLHLQC